MRSLWRARRWHFSELHVQEDWATETTVWSECPSPAPASPSLQSLSPPGPIASVRPDLQCSSGSQQYSSKNQSVDYLSHTRRRNRLKSKPKTGEKCDKSNIPIPQFSSNSQPALQFSPRSSPLRATSVYDTSEADSPCDEKFPSSSSAPLHFQGTNNSSSKSKSPPEADSNCATPKTLPHCRWIQRQKDDVDAFSLPGNCNSVLGILTSFSYRKKTEKVFKSQSNIFSNHW